MSIAAVQELIAKQVLDSEILSLFIHRQTGEVTQRFECEYWDYKRQFYNLDDVKEIAELASDVLSFHNTRGGYIIAGITKDFIALGVHDAAAHEFDSARLNDKIRGYIGPTFHCKYAPIPYVVGGTRKVFAVMLVPARKGTAIPSGRNAPGNEPSFKKGELFLRVNDQKKRAETDAELAFLYSPGEPELIVGKHQLKPIHPRPGFRLFMGDYKELIGQETRLPKVDGTIDALLYDKWDIISLCGVGGIGKTSVAIEATMRLAYEHTGHFGGIFSISCKSEELTPYERRGIKAEIVSHEEFLREFLNNADWDGNVPDNIEERERIVKHLISDKNILLFIDNYETLETRESRVARFIKDLPRGAKTLITSRHQPKNVPALTIDILPFTPLEAQIFAVAEATAQRVSSTVIERYLDQIVSVSSCLPLAIKWIISCSKNEDHLKQLIADHNRGKPSLANLCEFCFTFEYNLLSTTAKIVLVLFPLFHSAPTKREVATAADLEPDIAQSALEELLRFNLVFAERAPAVDSHVYRMLELTASFARTKLRDFGDLERQARRRLKIYYGASMPILISAAEEMVLRRSSPAARQYIEEEIIDREPENARGFYLRGQTFEQELHYAEAMADYEAALTKIRDEPILTAEVALRILGLSRSEPRYSREAIILLLTKAHEVSKSPELALELGKLLEIQGEEEQAQRYYLDVYRTPGIVRYPIWELATTSIARHRNDKSGCEAALKFIREALKMNPHSKALLHSERQLAVDIGEVRVKTLRFPGT